MVTSKQIVSGVLEYADKRVLPKLESSRQFLAGTVLGIAASRADPIVRELGKMPMVAMLGVVAENGDVDLDALYSAASAQIERQKTLPIDIPVIGRLTFDKTDIDELYQIICRQ